MNGGIDELVWVVVEQSPAGDSVLGVFASLTRAREYVSSLGGDSLEDYRIEGHVMDRPREEVTPWHVALGRDGDVLGVLPFAGCSCADDEVQFRKLSYIEAGGERMYVIVMARTPGLAVAAAQGYRAWLQDNGAWSERQLPLEPIQEGAVP